MSFINEKLLRDIVDKVSNQLAGDWIIIGGTVLPLVGVDHRVTMDVDMVPFAGNDNESLMGLMTVASELGLPVETINQAGGFFLQKIAGWKEKTILIKKGKKGRVFRPSLELFFELKLSRLSESDLQDCIEYFKWCRDHKELEKEPLLRVVKNEIKKKPDADKLARLELLLKRIG